MKGSSLTFAQNRKLQTFVLNPLCFICIVLGQPEVFCGHRSLIHVTTSLKRHERKLKKFDQDFHTDVTDFLQEKCIVLPCTVCDNRNGIKSASILILSFKLPQKSIVEALEKICSLLPDHYKEQCDNFLETYGEKIIDFLLTSATPHTICTLLHLCLVEERPALGNQSQFMHLWLNFSKFF